MTATIVPTIETIVTTTAEGDGKHTLRAGAILRSPEVRAAIGRLRNELRGDPVFGRSDVRYGTDVAAVGVEIVTPLLKPYVVPLAAVILLAVFAIQRFGSDHRRLFNVDFEEM